MASTLKSIIIFFSDMIYWIERLLILPVVAAILPPGRVRKDRDVLHTGHLTLQPRIMCGCLKAAGLKADYMAFTHRFSKSSWLKADHAGADFLVNPFVPLSCIQFFFELIRFYRIVLRYRIVHSHSLRFASASGWELPFLKRTGTKIVVHYRGCDIRSPGIYTSGSIAGHNSCEECDYDKSYCENRRKSGLREIARRFGDAFLVTTPDLLDFEPDAEYIPFFAPLVNGERIVAKRGSGAKFEIVHATNHEGIDGTRHIVAAVEKLKAEGFDVHLEILKRCPYEETLAYYKGADIAVGKLMMGFYANSQIEAMLLGTATVAYIREDLRKYLDGVELVEASPETVFEVLRKLLVSPDETRRIGERQREQVKRVHNNEKLTRRLVEFYNCI